MHTARKIALTATAALLTATALIFTASPTVSAAAPATPSVSTMGWIPDYPLTQNAAPATLEWPDFLQKAPGAATQLDTPACC